MSDPADAVVDLVFGRWRSQILYAGVELGLFEALADGPRTAREVADELELPKVVREAGDLPEEVGVADRTTFTAGDMFEAVPQADAYLMKHILHDWDDAECVEILESVREAAPAGAPVFVAEHVVPGPDTPHFAKLFDIHILVATTGRERTVEEYGELFRRAGSPLVSFPAPGARGRR